MNYIVLDTETTNGFDDPFCYDVGYAVLNESFEVIETRSFVVADVFLDKEMMANAYFADKIPQYWEDIKNGVRELKHSETLENSCTMIVKTLKLVQLSHTMHVLIIKVVRKRKDG